MATFLLEVGTEELPASFVSDALSQWQTRVVADLQAQALEPESVRFYGTPRRLAMVLEGLPDRQPDRTEEVKGPPPRQLLRMANPPRLPRVLPGLAGSS